MIFPLTTSSVTFGTRLARLCVLAALWVLPPAPGQAQVPALDSLRRVVRQQPADSGAARALAEIAGQLLGRDQDSSAYYARRAVTAARPFPALAPAAYLRLGNARYYQSKYAEARQAYDSAYALAQGLRNPRLMGDALRRNGNVALEQGDYSRALANYRESAQVHAAAGQVVEGGMALGNIGYLYKQIGDYDKALTVFFQELRTMEQAAHNPQLSAAERKTAATALGSVLSYIGETYNRTQNWDQARRYLTRLLAYHQQRHDDEGLAATLGNLANTNSSSGQLPLAETQLRQALAINQARHDGVAVAIAHDNLAEILAMEQKYAEAVREYQAGLVLHHQHPSSRYIYHAFVGLANSLLALRQPAAARAALDSTRRYLALVQSKQAYSSYYKIERNYYEQVGQPQQALLSYHQYELYQDSLLSADKAKVMADLGVKYDTEKKEAENRLQASQLLVQQQVIRRRNVQLGAALAVALLLGGLAYLAYSRHRLRQRLEREQERQQLQQQRTTAVLEAEENERRRIGSDLHDGVGQLLSAAKLNLHALGEELHLSTDGQLLLLQNALDVVDESFREVRSISHNLMPNALIKQGLAAAVRDFISKMTSHGGLRAEVEMFGLDERLPAQVEGVLFRVIQELAQNIVKHAQASLISLQLVRSAHELTVMVEDNGVGFDPAARRSFTGIGLNNIETRLAYLGGQAEFDSALGRGTIVTLTVPLASSPETSAAA